MRVLLSLLLFLAFINNAVAQTGSSQSLPAIQAEINTLFPDNTTGVITPFILRQVTQDIATSAMNSVSLTGDCTSAGPTSITCTKTNGVSFGPLATQGLIFTPGHYLVGATGGGAQDSKIPSFFVDANPYNAHGDGVTDDTTAISNALTDCGTALGGTVVLGSHRYLVNSGNLTVPAQCKVKCNAPLLGSRGVAQPINFSTVTSTVLLNTSFTITLNAGSGWQACSVINSALSGNPVTTRDQLNNLALFAGTAFSLKGDTTLEDTAILGFNLGLTTTTGAPRIRLNRVNIDAIQCTQFDNIHDIPYIWSLHCFPFTNNGRSNTAPSYTITNIADNGLGSHLYRVTTSAATVAVTGDTMWVTNNTVGASSAQGRWTVTVIDTTHVDLQGSTSLGVTPTGNNVSGSYLVTNLSSTANIGVGSTITGTGIPVNTTVSSILYTCGCIILSNASTSTNTGITLTIADNAYASGGLLFLDADWRSGVGIEFTNTDRSVCVGCFSFNHNINFHIGTLAQWIGCSECTSDGEPIRDPQQIALKIDSTAKAAMFSDFAILSGQNGIVINSNANNTPHSFVGGNIDAFQGTNLIEMDNGSAVITGVENNENVFSNKVWVTVLDAVTDLVMTGNFFNFQYAAQSPTSLGNTVNNIGLTYGVWYANQTTAGTGYVPGDTITLAIPGASNPPSQPGLAGNGLNYLGNAIVYVANTQVVSATVAAGGATCTNGTQTLTGTTGTGTKFTASVNVAGNTVTAVNSITSGGQYTANPTSPDTMTGAGCAGTTLNVVMGVKQTMIQNPGNYSIIPIGTLNGASNVITGTQQSTSGGGTGYQGTIGFAPNAAYLLPPIQNPSGTSQQTSFCEGFKACTAVTTGTELTAFGWQDLQNCTTCQNDTAVGVNSQGGQVSGLNVTSYGVDTIRNQQSGNDNTAVGFQAFYGQTGVGGSRDTIVGSKAAGSNSGGAGVTTGGFNDNTGVGYKTLNAATSAAGVVAIGSGAGQIITSGGPNTLLGTNVASTTLQTGVRDILIGTSSNCDTAAGGTNDTFLLCASSGTTQLLSGNLVSGSLSLTDNGSFLLPNITTDATHTDATVCEDTTTHQFYFGSGAAGICLGTSSMRFKHNIADLDVGLDQIMKLRAIKYQLNSDHGGADKILYGFTAEQGGKTLPQLMGKDAQDRPNTFDYMGVVPVLVKALQQQQRQIARLERKLARHH